MYFASVTTCFSRTQYIAAFRIEILARWWGVVRREEQKPASVTPVRVVGESPRTGNGGRSFTGRAYRGRARDGGGRIVSSGVRKGGRGRRGGVECAVCATERAAECAVRPIPVSRASFHQRGPLLCARKVPAEYIVGGTHARTTSFGDLRRRCLSSPPSGPRTRSTAVGLFEDSAQIARDRSYQWSTFAAGHVSFAVSSSPFLSSPFDSSPLFSDIDERAI